MKTIPAILSLSAAFAVHPLHAVEDQPIQWNPEVTQGSAVVEWVESAGKRELKIVNATNQPATVQLAIIESPEIQSSYYGIDGQVGHEGVEGVGFLEMWNHFPAGANGQPTAFFSRTLSDTGLSKKLSGTSENRPFRLPFNAEGSASTPNRLVINLQLPGKGTVYLGPATLHNYSNAAALMSQLGSWWPVTWSGWIGGIVGTVFGCWCTLIGFLSQKGKARSFVMASWVVNVAVGSVSLVIGLIALAMKQPYHVWYPLILIGVILLGVLLGNRRKIMAHYTEIEERRMAALDAAAR